LCNRRFDLDFYGTFKIWYVTKTTISNLNKLYFKFWFVTQLQLPTNYKFKCSN